VRPMRRACPSAGRPLLVARLPARPPVPGALWRKVRTVEARDYEEPPEFEKPRQAVAGAGPGHRPLRSGLRPRKKAGRDRGRRLSGRCVH
jgi:hypothetical protein